MQLKYIAGLKPLTISGILLANSASACAYSDIDRYSNINSIISNNQISDYVKDIQSTSYSEILLRSNFQDYLTRWEKRAKVYSSVQQIIRNKDFQNIVSMGDRVVPLIITELERKPSFLVWALNLIFDKKITNNPNTTVEEACKLWVKKLKA